MASQAPAENGHHSGPLNLRLRPAIIIVSIQWILWFILPAMFPGDTTTMIRVFGGFAGGLAVLIWWLFFSRVPLPVRWAAFALMILSTFVLTRLADPSITTAYQGMMIYNYVIPSLSLALVLWAILARRLSRLLRPLILTAMILVSCGFWTLFRSEGISGSGGADLAWRWSETYEEKFLSGAPGENEVNIAAETAPGAGAEWPGFRGTLRDGVVHGIAD